MKQHFKDTNRRSVKERKTVLSHGKSDRGKTIHQYIVLLVVKGSYFHLFIQYEAIIEGAVQ